MRLLADSCGSLVRLDGGAQGVAVAAGECFDALYRTHSDYYGPAAPRDFCAFLAGRSVGSLNCLDLGAGQGRYALHLARAGARVRAVDCSAVAMAQLAGTARAEKLAITTEVIDLRGEGVVRGAYDLIVGATILDHLDAASRQRLAAAIVAALKPGGALYCEVFTTSDPGWHRPPNQPVSETAGPVRHYFAAGELRSLFPQLTLLNYREGLKRDRAHGVPHDHGLALLIGVKEDEPAVQKKWPPSDQK